MNRFQTTCLIAALAVVIMAWYVSPLNIAINNQEKKPISPDAVTCSQYIDSAYIIEDLSKISQDIRPFAAGITESISPDAQPRVIQKFRERYFAPWTATAPLFKSDMVTEGVKMLAERPWYGENRLNVEKKRIQGLLVLADLDRFPSMNQLGVVIKPAFIRVLPTSRPFYETRTISPLTNSSLRKLSQTNLFVSCMRPGMGPGCTSKHPMQMVGWNPMRCGWPTNRFRSG
jgi:hypothetical protein